MVTVPEAAHRLGVNPETVRRWIREGRLHSQKLGTQHLIEDADLPALSKGDLLPLPRWMRRTATGEPMPDVLAALRRQRRSH